MIYEFRTYTLKPRSLGEVEKRYAEAYEYRKKYSPLAAFWHTEVGPLNEIIHVWGYKDLAERARIRAEAAKEANWPPKIRDFIVDQNVEVLNPFPFIPDITPGTLGPIFEIRRYTLAAGSLPGVMKRWEAALPARIKLSPWSPPAGWSSAARTASSTSGPTRPWTSGCRCGSRGARPASGRPRAAGTSCSPRRPRS